MSTVADGGAGDGATPGVTVVLACRDAVSTVARTLDCLHATSFRDFEVVLVDDASSDGTGELLAEAGRTLPRATVLHLAENVGVARARNAALEYATGTYVWFVDADDSFGPEALGLMYAAAVDASADVVLGRALEVDARAGTSRIVDGLDRSAVLDLGQVCTAIAVGDVRGFLWSKLFQRACLPVDPFPSVRSQSDFLGLMAVLDVASIFAVIPDVVYTYHRSNDSITTRSDLAGQLLACREAFVALLTRRNVDVLKEDLAWFTGVLTYLAGADSILRAAPEGRSLSLVQLRGAAHDVTSTTLRAVARRAPLTAARLAVALLLPRCYTVLYAAARGARERVRSRRRR